jgi:ATP-dependent DNA helicase PIF1
MDTLNSGQRAAFDAIMEGKSIFLTGPGGTGKSFLIKEVFDQLNKPGHSVSLTAMTGCAALLLHSKAKTLHSWSGIGLGADVVPLLVGKIKKSRRAMLGWLKTDTLVIDEVSMLTAELFEKLEEIARKVRKNDSPFGGLQLIMVGDFFQLPPVSKGEETKFVFESPLWKTMGLTTYALTEIVRQKNPEFQAILNEARTGTLTKASLKVLRGRIDLDYKSLEIQPSMLFTRRGEVDSINTTHLKKLTTEKKTYTATTVFNPITQTHGLSKGSPEVEHAVQALDKVAAYSVELTLAVGAQVMLLTNMNPGAGLVNGSRGVVVGFERPPAKEAEDLSGSSTPAKHHDILFPVVRFKSGCKQLIQFHDWELQEFPGVKRQQIPLKLAYAITIHKAQGATLDCALIDVGGRTFEYGQAYTALSRVKDMESLYIHDIAPEAFKAHPKVVAFYAETQP